MKNTRDITITALFAAIATILMYLEFPLPFMPPFLKVDISGVVVLIAALTLGPVKATLVLLIKDVIHLLQTQTGGVGELADFIMLFAMIMTLTFTIRLLSGKRGVILGCIFAVFALVISGTFTNKFLLIPFYSQIMPLEAIISACRAINPNVDSINTYILWGVIPFNAIKGIIVSSLTILLNKRIGKALKQGRT